MKNRAMVRLDVVLTIRKLTIKSSDPALSVMLKRSYF